ncbi:MAG: enoyl-CoA hydratase/isomerase family protein, partial [Pseudomonadales bacterium]|nr:enoyl-CoA hydratase/isomerase family protein [Pseudomonadales bacterium]
MSEVSQFEVRDRVAWITLDRPEAMNSLNPPLRWELSRHFDEVADNDDIWLAVVTGAGERAFCAGADLKHRALEATASEDQKAEWRRMAAESVSLTERWYYPKPVIAMVNGYALGGGLELAMACARRLLPQSVR